MPKIKERKTPRATKKVKKEFKSKTGIVFCVGDTVMLKAKVFETRDPQPAVDGLGRKKVKAKITSLSEDTKGLVFLEHRLGGYYTWDVNDLIKVG